MKTIFLTSFHSLISRNILQTDVFRGLLDAGVRIVLLVPSGKVEYFTTAFGGPQVTVEGVSVPKASFEEALYLFSMSLVGVENHIVRGWKTEGKYMQYYGALVLHALFARFFLAHRMLRFLARVHLRTETLDHLLSTYAPDLVCTTDTFNREDRALLLAAKRRGIRTLGLIRSWDNATTKGVLLAVPDHVVVTNEVLKEELIGLHQVTPERITVTGIPHYDTADLAHATSREAFFATLGLDTSKKTVLVAPGGKILYEHDRELLACLKRLNDSGALGEHVQFLVRLPPSDTADTSSVSGDSAFIIDDPGTNVTGRKKDSELSQDDNQRLIDSLAHCDVLVTLASTMVIDAMVFGKPAVVIGFEPAPKLHDSVKKFARYKHLKKILATGLIRMSMSEKEFARDLREGLDEPQKDAAKRVALLSRYAYTLDGNAGKRVVAAILAQLR